MSNNIEKLRNDEDYYGKFGKQWISNSDIKTLLEDPKLFRVDRPDNLNFAKGRLFHQEMLEPLKAADVIGIDVSSRNTKAYKERIADMGVDFIMLGKEIDEVREWVKVMKAHPTFYDMIYAKGNVFEQPGITEINGMPFKGKADIITDKYVIDLKTTGDIKKFKWNAKTYCYDSQAYIYEQIFGKPMIFLVIDKTTGVLGIFNPSEEFKANGQEKVEEAIAVYDKYFGEFSSGNVELHYVNEII